MAVWHEQMGMTPTEIAATYPTITLAQVHAALAYYYDHRDEIRAAIEDEHRFVEELRAKTPSLLQEKLKRLKGEDVTDEGFHLDEHCDPAIAAGLRLHGVDVTSTAEAGLLHARDEDHLAYGVATGRVIFTQDQDFLSTTWRAWSTGASRSATSGAEASVKSSQICFSFGKHTNRKRWRTASNTFDGEPSTRVHVFVQRGGGCRVTFFNYHR